MDSVIRKTKIDNIVSGDIIDNLKKLKDDSSFNEEAMFNNNLSVLSSDNQRVINVSDELTKGEDCVKLYKKSVISLILKIASFPLTFVSFFLINFFIFHASMLDALIITSVITFFFFIIFAVVEEGDLISNTFKKYNEFKESRYESYKDEVDEKRLLVKSNFVNPKIIGKYDELFFVLKKLAAKDRKIYKEDSFKSNIMNDLISYGVLTKVQFNGKEDWTPENNDIMELAVEYEYDVPNYAVTNYAINVFLDDDGITESLFNKMEENAGGLMSVAMIAKDEETKYILDVLVVMRVLDIRYFPHINESVVEFGPRYKDYLAYMESRS